MSREAVELGLEGDRSCWRGLLVEVRREEEEERVKKKGWSSSSSLTRLHLGNPEKRSEEALGVSRESIQGRRSGQVSRVVLKDLTFFPS